jgi:preprotein translocase subunit SecA
MPDRRWSDGLHQAIEAKEGVTIRQNNETAASVTYQNFFLLYPKLSGMTGTAKTAELEFEKIYDLAVVEIPTARPNLRKDLPDLIYKDELSKWNAIAKECGQISQTSQPILVGTTSVEKSEMLGQLLNEYNLTYQILNAKPENVRRESEIVAQAGNRNSITIATNMAGRGTDIILGGNIKFKVLKQLYTVIVTYKSQSQIKVNNLIFPITKNLKSVSHKFISVLDALLNNRTFIQLADTEILRILNETDQIRVPILDYQRTLKFLISELTKFEKKTQRIDNTIVRNLGGLYIIGTERNDSRRIDNQLRGRCARQGDPGTSQFFLSLEDRLLRLFGGPKIQEFMKNQFLDDTPIEAELLSKSLDSAQQRLEEISYDSRKNLFEYDEILNKQRKVIYYERRKILESVSVQTKILADGEQILTEIISQIEKNKLTILDVIPRVENLFGTNLLLLNKFKNNLNNFDPIELKLYLFQEFWLTYETKVLELEIRHLGIIRALERTLILIYIDTEWKEHLQKMALLRDAVGWRSYGQRNPLFEYKDEAYEFFKRRSLITRHLVIYDLIRSSII